MHKAGIFFFKTPPLMELSASCCVLGVVTLIFMFFVWRVSNWFCFVSTKKTELLRDQRLDNSSYKSMFGEIKDMVQKTNKSKSKLISLAHDMAPRVAPFFYRSTNTHEFQVGDRVMLKASSWKGIVRFEKNGKFSPRFLGPFTVLERVGSQSYKLDLPHEMHDIHDTFHAGYLYKSMLEQQNVIPVSNVRIDEKTRSMQDILDTKTKRLPNKQIIQNEITLPDAHIDGDMRYIEEPVAILDTKIMRLRNKEILLVKVQWRHRRGVNVTWEPKEDIQKRYPKLFA